MKKDVWKKFEDFFIGTIALALFILLALYSACPSDTNQ
jgi:hypothetical protein